MARRELLVFHPALNGADVEGVIAAAGWQARMEHTVAGAIESARMHRPELGLAVLRDDARHLERGFVVEDGAYVSARWPGDVYRFTAALLARMTSPSAT